MLNINKVTLYSHAWNEMRNFYVDVLGFELLSQTVDGFEIKAGESVLEIEKKHHKEKPFYHFAMNIPTNLFASAKAWAKSKVELTREEDDDEVYFISRISSFVNERFGHKEKAASRKA